MTDSSFYTQWGLHSIHACEAWAFTTGSPNVKVAVVDMGVDIHHRELNHTNVYYSYDAMSSSSPAQLYYIVDNGLNKYHGTHVGGIIFANHNSNQVAGISPSASLINISHSLQANTDEKVAKLATAIQHSVQQGAHIINNSWGDHGGTIPKLHSSFIENAIDNAINAGCLVVFAAGNRSPNMDYPATYRDEILTVGSSDEYNMRSSFSAYGMKLDIVAPGSNIYSTNGQNGYLNLSGTSMAAPHVSGVAALMLSVNPNLTAANVRTIIENTAEKVGNYSYQSSNNHTSGTWNAQMGYGLVDAHKAVVHALEYGHDNITGSSTLADCDAKDYQCDFLHPDMFTYNWTASANLSIVDDRGSSVTVIPVSVGVGTLSVDVYQQGRLMYTLTKSIQVTSVWSGVTPVSTTPFNISSNTTWSTETYLPVTATIDPNVTLTITNNLLCGDGARLIVRPGGKLVVDGGTLTSACPGEMWQGIEVVGDRTKRQLAQYQGRVVLCNGAVIENALCGIHMGLREDTVAYATAGGIIIADSACFRNNRRAVVINSYAYTDLSGTIENYSASFTRCTLTVDNSNLFAANNTAFAEHVRLWDVKGVVFDGCTFSNTANNLFYSGKGIYADDAGILVNTYCRPQVIYECECPEEDAKHNFFSGFSAGIEVNTTGNPYIVTVDGARFENNVTGVRVNGNNHATVTRCRFDLSDWPEDGRNNHGLYLNGCTGYKVEQDTFLRATYPSGPLAIDNSTGIYVSNSGASANSLYLNAFFNLTRGISVSGNNGQRKQAGLRISCNHFQGGKYDIYLNSGATIDYVQGTSTKGADNVFDNNSQNISNLYNSTASNITYYYYVSGTNLEPVHRTGVTPVAINNENSCASTLCNYNGGGSVYLAGFQSGMNAYTTALAGNDNLDNTDNNNSPNSLTDYSPTLLAGMRQSLSETYYEAVRALMSDTVLDLSQLEQWHAAAQPIADPYSLTETRFMEGYAETFAGNAENAEMANYAEFHTMKMALRNNDEAVWANNYSPLQPGNHINWYALTPAQIAQLQTIAERNTGRASVMAKGVLCFFFGICYDDEVFVNDNMDNQDNLDNLDNQDNQGDPETRSAKATQPDDDTNLTVYPNPTDDLLYIELTGAGIATVALYDLQGRAVETLRAASLQGGTATLNMHNIPAGVYVLHVTDTEGREYLRKVVRR